MSDRKSNPLFTFVCLVLGIAPFSVLFVLVFYLLLPDNKKLLIALFLLYCLILLVYPNYLFGIFIDAFNVIKEYSQIMMENNSVLPFLFSLPFKYSLLSHVSLIHISSIASLYIKEARKENRKFLDDFKKLKKKAEGERTMKRRIFGSIVPYKEGTVIGTHLNNLITVKDDSRHIFVCGTTGSGKTVALINFIKRAIEKDYPLLILDGKGDTGHGSIIEATKKLATGKKIYVIDMNNPRTSDKYNPFRQSNPSVMKDMLINLTDWSEEHYKANTERYLQRIIWLINKKEIKPSFKTLLDYLNPDTALDLAKLCFKEEIITKEEYLHTNDTISASGKIALEASARFITIYESEIGEIFSDENGIDIFTALNEKAIIIFILNPLLYPETSILFGRLVLIDSKKAVSKLFENRHERIFYVLDEISTYASTTLIDLINKSRSANVTCIVATQSLSDLDAAAGEAFKEQIIENCNNYIVLRQNSAVNAENWSKILGTTEGVMITHQFGNKGKQVASTGLGSMRPERRFLYHPDDIKRLKTGEAILMMKEENEHFKIKIRKGF